MPVSVKRLLEVLIERLTYQEHQIQEIQTENAWLKEKLSRDSSNSSLSPWSDKKQRIYPKREGSGKKRGGQPGHELHTRPLYAVEECESVEDYYPTACWKCGLPLHHEESEPHRHQIVELPIIVALVKAYRLHQCVCEECNALTRARLPEEVSRKGYGPSHLETVEFWFPDLGGKSVCVSNANGGGFFAGSTTQRSRVYDPICPSCSGWNSVAFFATSNDF